MIVLMLIVVVCLAFLSLLVASQNFNKAPNLALLLSVLLLGVWVLMVFGLRTVFESQLDYQTRLTYSRAIFAVGALSLLSLVWFVATLLSGVRRMLTMLRRALFVSGGAISLLCFSPYIIAGVSVRDSSVMPFPTYGMLMPVYMTMILLAAASILYMVLWGSAREQEARRREQIRTAGIAIALAIATGLVTNLVVPWLTGDANSSLYMTVSILILVAGLSLAIIRHGLFDIRIAAVRTLGYVLTLSLLAVVYVFLAYAVSVVFLRDASRGPVGSDFEPVNIGLALLLSFLFQPVRQFFTRLTDNIFYRVTYDSEAFYGRFSKVLTVDSTDLPILLRHVAKEVESTFKAEQVFFCLRWDDHRSVVGTVGHSTLSEMDIKALNAYVAEEGDVLIVADALPEESDLYRILTNRRISIAIPLMQTGVVLGYMLLGSRRSSVYTARDVKVLETISNELSIAIQNALSVQSIKEINDTLQQSIEAATSELRTSNEQLRRLDAAKDEFVSMASHQLRTPLTSVKGYISMVLEGDVGEVTPMQRQLLEEAFASSERMVHLISDFLNVSRLQTGKFVVEKSQVNLPKLVKQEVDSLASTAQAHSLKLKYRKPAYFPELYLDEGKVRQVVMNFIDNAIYYSREHSTILVNLATEDGDVVFTVQDSGIGVPKDQQAHLFTKFFRADNARRQRPDGTGVGLYLAKKVVVAHGGSIVFESVEGEGSTFGFRLPIKKLSTPPHEDHELPEKIAKSS